jgi:hypothetical protein
MAAGQGFKTFTTGEVLTAGDVNGYLMQGVLVFASAAARDAAITSPQEGQFAFTKDTNGLWYYDGAAWVASGATGDIEGVTAGVGISGGGTSGTVTVTNSMATAIDAKGDLVAGTGADTFAKLTVGANGTTLVADSAEATGLKWAAPSGASYKGVSLFGTTAQSIPNATNTIMTFDSESWDTDGFHSTSSNTSRITIPSGLGGKYLVTMNMAPELNGIGARYMELYKNGSRLIICYGVNATSTAYIGLYSAFVVDLVATDYLEIMVYQDKGSALNFGRGANISPFSATYLGA